MQTPNEIWENPTLAWALEASIINAANGSKIVVLAGLGIQEGMFSLPDENVFLNALLIARHQEPARWHNLDIRHLHDGADANQQICALDVVAALAPAGKVLTQDALDFITLRDIKQTQINCVLLGADMETINAYSEDDIRLAVAWRKQLVDETEPYRYRVPVGAYIMRREALPALDKLLAYHELRLIITPVGMFVSIVAHTSEGEWYAPFWWSPDNDVNTAQMFVSPRVRFLLDVMCAAIWRDACVVQEVNAFKRTGGTAYESRASKPVHQNPLAFPRKVYRVLWGTDEERAEIERRAARAHDVRAHYRWLGDRNASDTAAANAESFGFPAPPAGFTFVKPYVRGEGERAEVAAPAPRRAVFRGLQTAKILLA